MKEFLLLTSLVLLQDGLRGTLSEVKTQYITIPGTVVLSCQYEQLPSLRWRRGGSIISQGSRINPAVNGSERFRAINKPQDKQYELHILKTTEEDLGLYVCEAQLSSVITGTTFILKLADFIISTEENIISTMFIDNDQSTTFISEENSTFVSEEKSTVVSEEKSTGLPYKETTSERQSTITNKDYKEENANDTGLSFREKFYYGLLAAGLALVLFLSVLCNFCINRKCKKGSSPILKESPTSQLQIMEENIRNDNQRLSLKEMDEISVYESINENQMLSNLALAMQSNGRTVGQLKRSQLTSSTTSSEKSYCEIADDNAYLNPYQPMKSDRESSNLHKYSTTSNTDKSLQKPQCDDDVQHASTLLEADVVNLSDNESSPDDDNDEIIDKGDGYLHPYMPLDSNDLESLKNNYTAIKKYKDLDNKSCKIECSTDNEDEVTCEDGYLHPYVPLMTNCMEYLHSYSSPINQDQLKQNNQSLTSSPYDDMDIKVPIAEQKTKDSVGKENAMNLSDHESSESDGDTDAMCGNGDGYLHPYVPLMTNCMEYLHSYSSPVINNSPVINSSLVINSSPIINEDQLMKTKSSKLTEYEHCESVMKVTNDEDYTDGWSSNAISS